MNTEIFRTRTRKKRTADLSTMQKQNGANGAEKSPRSATRPTNEIKSRKTLHMFSNAPSADPKDQ